MADLLERGSRWLESQRHRHLAREVTYCRGEATVVLRATVGRLVRLLTHAKGTALVPA